MSGSVTTWSSGFGDSARVLRPHLWRKLTNWFMFGVAGLCAVSTISVLLFILGYLVWNGARALNWDFLTQLPKPVGEAGGGVVNAIVGSAKLVSLAALMGIPDERRAEFFALAQVQYASLIQSGDTTPAAMLKILHTGMETHPTFAKLTSN